ncbi:hypothetical protein [Micromonospora zhanjiangensis]|uniref:Uncharacterized protein n=1 Tax=Micromonospora zhanjiangensis TaxID=1522057 RepID=A0ABV8KI36_9ACTN
MNQMPLASWLSHEVTNREVLSARPDAPVVPDRKKPARTGARTRQARTAVAGALHRVARAVEPAGC